MNDHVRNIATIMEVAGDAIAQLLTSPSRNLGFISVTLPSKETIDADKFNRMMVVMDGGTYTISVFQNAAAPLDGNDPQELVQSGMMSVDEIRERTGQKPVSFEDVVVDEPGFTCPPTFTVDFRIDKPNLHKLYVRFALEELLVINDFYRSMDEFSRVSASILRSTLATEVRKEIMRDAAWFEAAALIQSGVNLEPYLRQDQEEFNPLARILVGRSLADHPPGTYKVRIELIGEQLYIVDAESDHDEG